MIISASRRTDIPAFYADWFYHRIREGYVYVRNPMNFHQISKISLSPAVVDGIVFWTKNPVPMIGRLHELDRYTYYFQFTLNSYATDVEPNVSSKHDVIIPVFQQLSSRIGKDRVVWRYDPILLNEKYTMQYHIKYFALLADRLANYTENCTVSFLDLYKNTQRNMAALKLVEPSFAQKEELMGRFAEIAHNCGISMDTCAEELNFSKFGIRPAHCIDRQRFEKLGNYPLNLGKDKNQRPACGCAASIDIGAYNTCAHGCLYCYANYLPQMVERNFSRHNPKSPLLFGCVEPDDVVKVREITSCRDDQLDLLTSLPQNH